MLLLVQLFCRCYCRGETVFIYKHCRFWCRKARNKKTCCRNADMESFYGKVWRKNAVITTVKKESEKPVGFSLSFTRRRKPVWYPLTKKIFLIKIFIFIRILVDDRGIEPLTSALRTPRSPSWANRPDFCNGTTAPSHYNKISANVKPKFCPQLQKIPATKGSVCVTALCCVEWRRKKNDGQSYFLLWELNVKNVSQKYCKSVKFSETDYVNITSR